MFETSGLFLENLNEPSEVIVNQGGTYSTKTYSILQVFFHRATSEKATFTVVGQDIPNLKSGALRDAQHIVENSPVLQSVITSYNKSERIYEFATGSILEFKSYSDSQDAKSGKRDYLFVNEANGIPKPIYDELALRTNKKIFIDYNPNAEFWVHDELIGKPGVKLLISDHRCNPFISQRQHDKIEGIQDRELWKVYARGLTGKIEGLVFSNWVTGEHQIETEPFYGLDFGFNDPCALVEIRIAGNRIEAKEIWYRTGMTTGDIIKSLSDEGISQNAYIYADSANPDKIEEIHRAGFNVHPQSKPKGSVIDGITKLKGYNMVIQGVNLKKELMSYKWKVDKNGRSLDEPIDFMNHAIDGLRSAVFTKLAEPEYDIDFIW